MTGPSSSRDSACWPSFGPAVAIFAHTHHPGPARSMKTAEPVRRRPRPGRLRGDHGGGPAIMEAANKARSRAAASPWAWHRNCPSRWAERVCRGRDGVPLLSSSGRPSSSSYSQPSWCSPAGRLAGELFEAAYPRRHRKITSPDQSCRPDYGPACCPGSRTLCSQGQHRASGVLTDKVVDDPEEVVTIIRAPTTARAWTSSARPAVLGQAAHRPGRAAGGRGWTRSCRPQRRTSPRSGCGARRASQTHTAATASMRASPPDRPGQRVTVQPARTAASTPAGRPGPGCAGRDPADGGGAASGPGRQAAPVRDASLRPVPGRRPRAHADEHAAVAGDGRHQRAVVPGSTSRLRPRPPRPPAPPL